MKKNKYIFLILGILITIFIFSQSLLKADDSSGLSNKITLNIYNVVVIFFKNLKYINFHLFIRKLAHFTEFFVLGLVWFFFYYKNIKCPYLVTLIHGFITASLDETIQLFVEGRVGSFMDVLIDSFGVFTALLIIYVVLHFLAHKDKVKNL